MLAQSGFQNFSCRISGQTLELNDFFRDFVIGQTFLTIVHHIFFAERNLYRDPDIYFSKLCRSFTNRNRNGIQIAGVYRCDQLRLPGVQRVCDLELVKRNSAAFVQ